MSAPVPPPHPARSIILGAAAAIGWTLPVIAGWFNRGAITRDRLLFALVGIVLLGFVVEVSTRRRAPEQTWLLSKLPPAARSWALPAVAAVLLVAVAMSSADMLAMFGL